MKSINKAFNDAGFKFNLLFKGGINDPAVNRNIILYFFHKHCFRPLVYLPVLLASIMVFPAQATLSVKGTEQSDVFRSGAAVNKITPPVGSIMGNSYGITISEGVHDDLYAKALVFEIGGEKAAFIALDLISLPYVIVVKARELIAESTGIPVNNIIMVATHVHAGPQMNPMFLSAADMESKGLLLSVM